MAPRVERYKKFLLRLCDSDFCLEFLSSNDWPSLALAFFIYLLLRVSWSLRYPSQGLDIHMFIVGAIPKKGRFVSRVSMVLTDVPTVNICDSSILLQPFILVELLIYSDRLSV